MLFVLSITGCNSAKVSTDTKPIEQPKTESAEAFAEKYLKATSFQQWDLLYTYLHPDIQAKYTKEQFIADRKENGVKFATDLKDYKIDTAVALATWSDTKGDGKEYKDVAEVPITYNFKDGGTAKSTIHLAKAPDATWRWFWSPVSASTAAQAPASSAPTPVTSEKKWAVTNSWSGNGAKDTENFVVTENTRINWETTGAQGIFQIYVQDKDGTPVAVAANLQGIGKDVSYLHIAPGQYSIKVNAANTPWKITVEQQQ